MSKRKIITANSTSFTNFDVRQLLSRVLLKHAEMGSIRQTGLSQSEMASRLNTSRNMVASALKSLQIEGAIRIDRNRIVINRMALEQIAVI